MKFLLFFHAAEDVTIEKKGNKEIQNDITMVPSTNSADNLDQNPNNASIDTSFLINGVNDHATIQHPSSEQHTEL